MPSSLPIHKIKSNGSWGGRALVTNVDFINWSERTECGRKQQAIKRNPYASDYIPMHKFQYTTFKEVAD
jgi:hypothetical protein